jgi:hypothetical protein
MQKIFTDIPNLKGGFLMPPLSNLQGCNMIITPVAGAAITGELVSTDANWTIINASGTLTTIATDQIVSYVLA